MFAGNTQKVVIEMVLTAFHIYPNHRTVPCQGKKEAKIQPISIALQKKNCFLHAILMHCCVRGGKDTYENVGIRI
jgi:hypothetical protein